MLSKCQPCEGIFELHSCFGLIFMAVFGNFDQLVLTHQTFFQKNFGLKSLLLVSTISGQMWTEIGQPQSNSNILGVKQQNFRGKPSTLSHDLFSTLQLSEHWVDQYRQQTHYLLTPCTYVNHAEFNEHASQARRHSFIQNHFA